MGKFCGLSEECLDLLHREQDGELTSSEATLLQNSVSSEQLDILRALLRETVGQLKKPAEPIPESVAAKVCQDISLSKTLTTQNMPHSVAREVISEIQASALLSAPRIPSSIAHTSKLIAMPPPVIPVAKQSRRQGVLPLSALLAGFVITGIFPANAPLGNQLGMLSLNSSHSIINTQSIILFISIIALLYTVHKSKYKPIKFTSGTIILGIVLLIIISLPAIFLMLIGLTWLAFIFAAPVFIITFIGIVVSMYKFGTRLAKTLDLPMPAIIGSLIALSVFAACLRFPPLIIVWALLGGSWGSSMLVPRRK